MSFPPYTDYPSLNAGDIVLRQIGPGEIDDIVEISFYDGQPAASATEALDMLERIHRDYRAGNSIHWGIADRDSNTIAGTCGYYRGFENESGELGCVLREVFRGKGIMTRAMYAAIDFGFSVIGLQRITATTTKQNSRAIKLLERLQFVRIAELEGDVIEYELRKPVLGV